jgi:putative endonuclease
MSRYFVYVLKSISSDILYTGHTDNLDRRLKQHNDPLGHPKKFAPKHAPWELMFSEEFPSRSEAMIREKFLKSGQGREWIRTKIGIAPG